MTIDMTIDRSALPIVIWESVYDAPTERSPFGGLINVRVVACQIDDVGDDNLHGHPWVCVEYQDTDRMGKTIWRNVDADGGDNESWVHAVFMRALVDLAGIETPWPKPWSVSVE